MVVIGHKKSLLINHAMFKTWKFMVARLLNQMIATQSITATEIIATLSA